MWSLRFWREGSREGKQHYVLFVTPAATASEITHLRRTFLESAETVTAFSRH